MKKIDFSDRMEAEKYFCGVVEQMRGVKVKAVFSCCPSFGDYDGIRRYIEDNEIYILLMLCVWKCELSPMTREFGTKKL